MFKLILFGGSDKLRPEVPCVILGSVFLLFMRCVWMEKESVSQSAKLATKRVVRFDPSKKNPQNSDATADITKLQVLLGKIDRVRNQFCKNIYQVDCDSVKAEFETYKNPIESAIKTLQSLNHSPYTKRYQGTVAKLLKKEDLTTVELAQRHFFEKSMGKIQKLQKSARIKGLALYNAAATLDEKREIAERFAPFFEEVPFGEEHTYLVVAHARRLKGLLDDADNKLDKIPKETSKAYMKAFLFFEYGLVEKKFEGGKDPVLEYAHRIVAKIEKRPEGIALLDLRTYRLSVYNHIKTKNKDLYKKCKQREENLNSRIRKEELEAISDHDHLSFDLYCIFSNKVVHQPLYSLLGVEKIPVVEYPDGTLEMLEQIAVRPQHQRLGLKVHSDLFKVRKRARDLIAEIRKKIQDKFNSLQDNGKQFAYVQRVFDQIEQVDKISSELDQGNKTIAHVQDFVKKLEKYLRAKEKNVVFVEPQNASKDLQVAYFVLLIQRFIDAIEKQVANFKDLECGILLERKEELQKLIKNLKSQGFTKEIQVVFHEEASFNSDFQSWVQSQLKQRLEKYGDKLWEELKDFYQKQYEKNLEPVTEEEMQLIRDMSSVWNSFFEDEFDLCPENFETYKKRFKGFYEQCKAGKIQAKEDDYELFFDLKYGLEEGELPHFYRNAFLQKHFEENKNTLDAPLFALKQEASKEKHQLFLTQKLLPSSLLNIDENILSTCYQNTLGSSTVTTTVMDYIVKAHSEQKKVQLFIVDYETKLLKKKEFFHKEFPEGEVLNLFHTVDGRIQILL